MGWEIGGACQPHSWCAGAFRGWDAKPLTAPTLLNCNEGAMLAHKIKCGGWEIWMCAELQRSSGGSSEEGSGRKEK